MNPLVSICVPVYNVADYIERCAVSLMEQTYQPLEYIFVDDCSTDHSIDVLTKVLERYPKRCEQVRILRNDRNRGPVFSRQKAIENATGEYICFVDSDDFVERNMVERLLSNAIEQNADIISAGNDILYPNGRCVIEQPLPEYAQYDALSFPLRGVFCSLWGAIYRTALFRQPSVFAPEDMYYLEDRLMRLKLALLTDKIYYVNDLVYHYCVNRKSITSHITDGHLTNFVRFWHIVDELLAQRGLSEQYKPLISFAKVQNKSTLMLHTDSMALRRKYADLFHNEEKTQMHLLRRGQWLMTYLIHHHLWPAVWIYQQYMNLLRSLFFI